MKTYTVTETYTTTRVLKVLAPDAAAAENWGIHPKSMVLDYGTYEERNHSMTAVEQKAKEKA